MPGFDPVTYAIPGFVRDSWFQADKPGVYRGQCSELCGKDHGFMPVVVRAVPEKEYDEWLAKKQAEAKAADKAPDKAPAPVKATPVPRKAARKPAD